MNLLSCSPNSIHSLAELRVRSSTSEGSEISHSQEEFRTNEPEYTLDEVANHCDPRSSWIVIKDIVYDVTKFLHEHPGGMDIIMEHVGRDATWAFVCKGHSSHAVDSLEEFRIGVLVEKERSYHVWKALCDQ